MNNGFLTSKWWIYDDLCGFHRFDIRNLVVNKQVIFVPNRRVIPHKGSFIQTYPNKLGFLTLFLGEWGFDQKDIAIYVELPYFCRRNWDVALNNQDLSISCLGEIGIEPGHTISPWFIRALWGPIHRWDPRFRRRKVQRCRRPIPRGVRLPAPLAHWPFAPWKIYPWFIQWYWRWNFPVEKRVMDWTPRGRTSKMMNLFTLYTILQRSAGVFILLKLCKWVVVLLRWFWDSFIYFLGV